MITFFASTFFKGITSTTLLIKESFLSLYSSLDFKNITFDFLPTIIIELLSLFAIIETFSLIIFSLKTDFATSFKFDAACVAFIFLRSITIICFLLFLVIKLTTFCIVLIFSTKSVITIEFDSLSVTSFADFEIKCLILEAT